MIFRFRTSFLDKIWAHRRPHTAKLTGRQDWYFFLFFHKILWRLLLVATATVLNYGGFQLYGLIISRVINHVTCYKFTSSHWLKSKPSGKLRRHTPSFGCILAVRPKKYFFRNKTFLFFKIESWNFQVQFEIKIRETSQNFNTFSFFRQLLFSSFFISCLIELKFWEISGDSFLTSVWKFQLSTFKNKKVLFLKKNLSCCKN